MCPTVRFCPQCHREACLGGAGYQRFLLKVYCCHWFHTLPRYPIKLQCHPISASCIPTGKHRQQLFFTFISQGKLWSVNSRKDGRQKNNNIVLSFRTTAIKYFLRFHSCTNSWSFTSSYSTQISIYSYANYTQRVWLLPLHCILHLIPRE